MSFLTGQDRTPKFAGQVLPDRTKSGLIFYIPNNRISFKFFLNLKPLRPMPAHFWHLLFQLHCCRLQAVYSTITVKNFVTVQGRKWRGGRGGNFPPRFWQNRRHRWAAARRQWRATLLLAHPVLGSHLHHCYTIIRNLSVYNTYSQKDF